MGYYPTMADANISIPTINETDLQRTLEANRPVKIAIISVLGVMITLSNVAVVMVITSTVPGWSRNSRYFLLSLTGADSAFGLLIMPLNLCVSFMKEYNEGPDPFCHVVAFFNATIYSTCMYTLATISLERYIAVFYPLKYSTLLTRKRALLLISFAWIFPPVLLVPISFPAGIIDVYFSRASLVCNPLYASNVSYSLTLTCFIFFPCSAIMTFCNLRLWIAAKRQRLKLRRNSWGGGYRPKVALRVLLPIMTVYYTCWTPCMVIMLYNAISGSDVPEWIEFIAVWLPTSNGFLNCIFYFWINHSFRKKFHVVLQRLCLGLCPSADTDLSCVNSAELSVAPGWKSNYSLHERFSSVSSNCTLLTLMTTEIHIREPEPA